MTVESNHVIALVLIKVGFLVGPKTMVSIITLLIRNKQGVDASLTGESSRMTFKP